MDKNVKKELKAKFKQQEKEIFFDSLPFEKEKFEELFDYLDEYSEENSCDHTNKATISFLEKNNLPVEKSLEWMKEYWGYCDCEILANVESSFERF